MELKVRVDEMVGTPGAPRKFAIVENVKIRETRTMKVIEGIATLDIPLGTFSKPYFYFSEQLRGVAEESYALGNGDWESGLARYIEARKPIHSLYGQGLLLVQFEARITETSRKYTITPLKAIGSLTTSDQMTVFKAKKSEALARAMTPALDHLLANAHSREDYYRERVNMYSAASGVRVDELAMAQSA